MEGQRSRCPDSPRQVVESSLERPSVSILNKSGANGVVLNVVPFFGIAFVGAELCVPTVALPYRLQIGELLGNESFPEGHPLLDTAGFSG